MHGPNSCNLQAPTQRSFPQSYSLPIVSSTVLASSNRYCSPVHWRILQSNFLPTIHLFRYGHSFRVQTWPASAIMLWYAVVSNGPCRMSCVSSISAYWPLVCIKVLFLFTLWCPLDPHFYVLFRLLHPLSRRHEFSVLGSCSVGKYV